MKRDRVWDYGLAAFLAVMVFLVALFYMDNNCHWGDDFSAYLLEGISIAEDRFDQQTHINYMLHNALLPQEVSGEESLVYAWGYPLILALVYRLAGFDRGSFLSIFYYKLPSLVCLALLAATAYLFFSRRLSRPVSFALSVMLCVNTEFLIFIENLIYSDIVFLASAMITLLLGDCFLSSLKSEEGAHTWRWSVALGVSLWATYEIRLNGVMICAAVFVAQLLQLLRHRELPRRKALLLQLSPYLLFLLLKLFSEALLAPATSNTSDLARWTLARTISNLRYYMGLVQTWVRGLVFNRRYYRATRLYDLFPYVFYILLFIGALTDGLRRDLHLVLYAAVSALGVCLLPYVQGLRYMYPLLPLLLLFAGYGLQHIWGWLGLLYRRLGGAVLSARRRQAAALLLTLVVIGFSVYRVAPLVKKEIAWHNDPSPRTETYSAMAVDMYHYIMEHTDPDALIMFHKPRSLYLNTKRLAIWDDEAKLFDADYYLLNKMWDTQTFDLSEDKLEHLRVSFENDEFALYQIQK